MSHIVPDSSGGGNTQISPADKPPKQAPSRKNHFFTYNNYDPTIVPHLVETLKRFAYKGKIQSEVGENGTPHLQGMIWCHEKHRDTEFKLPKQIHWKTLKDVDNIRDYCGKNETHDGLFRFSWGFPKIPTTIETLYPWQKNIEDIFLSEPDDRKIYWYWESEGGIGKSAFVKYMVIKHKCLFCDGGKKADLINLVFNNDMDTCRAVIWDLPRATRGKISYTTLESIKNGLVCNTKYETGVKAFEPPHIFVFANYPPDNPTDLSADRWVITEL